MKSALMITVQRFRAELEKMGIRCDRILLFGSQANGTAQEGSDIDLIVVSPDWARYNDRERFEILGIAAARILEPIQARGSRQRKLPHIASHRFGNRYCRSKRSRLPDHCPPKTLYLLAAGTAMENLWRNGR
jgi:predicted nucleotidyltransferase